MNTKTTLPEEAVKASVSALPGFPVQVAVKERTSTAAREQALEGAPAPAATDTGLKVSPSEGDRPAAPASEGGQ